MNSMLVVKEISAAISPEIVGVAPTAFESVTIDSRQADKGSLFVALPGEHTDGHRFVGGAFSAGAVGALVGRGRLDPTTAPPADCCLLIAGDTEQALHGLGRAALLNQSGMTRVGITGSNGKTTTKELVGSILKTSGQTFVTPGNFNSTIGIPLSLIPVEVPYRYGVFEMAMNRRGEMARLADLVRPDIALITNIGTAHIGMLGSQQAIAEEKAKIAARFDGQQCCLVPEADVFAEYLASRVDGRVIYFGETSTPDFGGVESVGLAGTKFRWRDRIIQLRIPGRHNVGNALGAIGVALELGIDSGSIIDGLESVAPLFGRGELIQGPITIFQDCYNANPESTRSTLELVAESAWPGRVILVLGPMKELGGHANAGHGAVLQTALSSRPAALYLIGEEYEESFRATEEPGIGPEYVWTTDYDELIARLSIFVKPGDLVVVKGSRAAALERVGAALKSVGA